jgi:hypothetical protein
MNPNELNQSDLQAVAISAKIVELEMRHPEQVDEINRLKTELKILENRLEPIERTDEIH